MSQKSREARRFAVAGAVALVALGAASSSANAAKLSLDYQCKYPLIGVQPLKLDIDAAIPSTWPKNSLTPAFAVNAVATAGGNTAKAIKTIGAQTLEGVANADARIIFPAGDSLDILVPVKIPKWTRPTTVPDPLVLPALDATPPISLEETGTVSFTLDRLSLVLTARDRSGTALQLAPVTKDIDGNPVTPSDSDPGTFDVPCKIAPGQSATIGTLQVTNGPTADSQAPSKPGALKAITSASTAELSWTASTDNQKVEYYDVYRGTDKVTSVSGTSALLGGLSPSTSYAFKVVARDAAGNSTSSDTVTASTAAAGDAGPGGQVINYGYDIAGTSQLRTLTTGPVPIKGSIGAKFDLLTGAFSGDLVLNKTRARLNLLSFIPVTADVAFVQSGPTVGTLTDGVLTATAKMRIRLPQLYLFGAVPVAGPGTCQTRNISTIPLKSTDAFFDPLSGGPMSGTYAISDLTACGALNDIISPFAAGGGNGLTIKLTPKN